MAWFSYFLLSNPENFFMVIFTFILLGLSVKDKMPSILLFAFIQGFVAFSLTVFIDTSFKPLLNLISFSLLVVFIFRRNILDGFIVGLLSFLIIVILELAVTLPVIQLLSLNITETLLNPWHRIFLSILTVQLPMAILIFVFVKFNIKIRIPLLSAKR